MRLAKFIALAALLATLPGAAFASEGLGGAVDPFV